MDMLEVPVSDAGTTARDNELGFSVGQGANWPRYLTYRPIYPPSFFSRIYDYHSQKPRTSWSVAHDVGAGCGIVSSALAPRFDNVIVSDPNDGYVELARQLLVDESSLPEAKFRFLQERAENSSLETGSVDLVAACECIQWTDPAASTSEFSRQLRVGGTLVITFYSRLKIVGHEEAEKAWAALWHARRIRYHDHSYDRVYRMINRGLDSLEFPRGEWSAVKRVYFNAHGSTQAFAMSDLIGETGVREGEERIWIENDKDWQDVQGIDWLKGYFNTWVPYVPEPEVETLWSELESIIGGGKVNIETPLVMIFATKKA